MVLRADLLMQKVIEKKYQITSSKSVGSVFGELQKGGKPVSGVVMHSACCNLFCNLVRYSEEMVAQSQ
jgi:hypothetical protein